MSLKSISAAKNASNKDENTNPAFDQVIGEILKDRSRLWNLVELYHLYQLFGGKTWLRRSLLGKIRDHFLDDTAVLSSPELASLVEFREHACLVTVLHLAGDNKDLLIGKLAKIIGDKVKQKDRDQSCHDIRIS